LRLAVSIEESIPLGSQRAMSYKEMKKREKWTGVASLFSFAVGSIS
jgi:hypothetical protein